MNQIIKADYHLHTSFSADSEAPFENMVRAGMSRGLTAMCVTEHLDKDYPEEEELDFDLDMEGYHRTFLEMRETYQKDIDLRFGIEIGLQPHLADFHRDYIKDWPFDFIIGSSHTINGYDPYYPSYYEGRTEEEAYLEYFQSILNNLDAFSDIDVYGHIDYVVRYGPNKNKYYTYERYGDILDEILKKLIEKGIGIECNTGGLKYGLGHPNPCEEVLARYRQLGGEILTVGSDAHSPEHVAYDFRTAAEILKGCGFRYYTAFRERKPVFLPLD